MRKVEVFDELTGNSQLNFRISSAPAQSAAPAPTSDISGITSSCYSATAAPLSREAAEAAPRHRMSAALGASVHRDFSSPSAFSLAQEKEQQRQHMQTAADAALKDQEHLHEAGRLRKRSSGGVGSLSADALAAEVEEEALHGTATDEVGPLEGEKGMQEGLSGSPDAKKDTTAFPLGLSHLQVGAKQIFDQLLTGMLGTGVNLIQGRAMGQAQPATMMAPAALPYGPTPAYYAQPETGLSTVEIVLIIAGSILAVGLIGLLVWVATSKKRHRR
ncbi:hypothetical protein, conserved [Eimeria maxima]|uniref:Transmembrane protein n=1 Tax=Eimeria maxima TaxID=5804 RepID=U6M3N9_EIMMA|nr:hypothetical protein, conserved [Eimeria maxima]CDJ58852.1 hypothetical protein, conserved [Eimeria maxima]